MRVTYFGTTTLLFDDGIDQIMFDCHVTRPSLTRYLFGTLSTDTIIADRVTAFTWAIRGSNPGHPIGMLLQAILSSSSL